MKNGEPYGHGIETCSQCTHPAATDSGARTVTLNNLQFDESVGLRVKFGYPFRGILFDQTGSTSDNGENSWIIPFYNHNSWEDTCQRADDEIAYNGMVCNNEVQVRRVAFHNYRPGNTFRGLDLRIH